jgi:hypothetical protein
MTMQQAPRSDRYWLLIGVLVVADLVVAAVILGWLQNWSASPFLLGFGMPSGTATVSLQSIAVSSAVQGQPVTSRTTPPPPSLPPLTLDSIFPPRDMAALKLDPKRLRTIIATGDVVPARSTDAMIRARGDDFIFTVAATQDLLAAGDITVVNLEAPIVRNCPPHDSGFKFCARPGFVQALEAAGVDVVTLENNHVRNYGTAGVTETIETLEAAHIAWAGGESSAVIDVRGVRFGFLAFNGVGVRFNRKTMVAKIKELRPKVDVLVAAMHWGAEYVRLPASASGIAPDNPVEIAHLAVDAGVDLIVGNHPHWIQPVEFYKGKLIAYAHGNFIFDQMWSDETRKGVIGLYTFYDRTLVRVEYIPVMIQDYAQPVALQGKASQEVLDRMKAASRDLARKPALSP